MNEDQMKSRIKALIINQMLEAELAKPAEKIDSDLVDRILDALSAPEPTPEQVETSWQIIKARVLKNYG